MNTENTKTGRIRGRRMRYIMGSLGLLLLIASCNTTQNNSTDTQNIYQGIEFQMPEIAEPIIPDNTVIITEFGAIPDGQHLNSDAFTKAIAELDKKGGGTLVIPKGIWLTGPIQLISNLNIHTEAGALVIFSTDKSHYPLIETSFEGNNTIRCMSPIYGKKLANISFTGKGVFDGSGEVWRHVKKSKLTSSDWNTLIASGGILNESGTTWYPSEGFMKGEQLSEMNVPSNITSIDQYEEIRDFLRPVMVSLVECKQVLIDGPTFQNSPAWCIHPLMCENLVIKNTTVRNPWFSQNGDGLDIESCKNTLIYNCNFDVGDDAICIKSGKDKDGRERGIATENLIVKNCIVYHGHGGVTIGSEMSGGVKNMHVSNCTFMGTDVGLRFKSNRGRGGIVENIYVSDIQMINIPTNAISFNLYYGGRSVSEMLEEGGLLNGEGINIPAVSEKTPQFKNIFLKNITCRGALQGVYLQGLPEMNLENIVLKNIDIKATNGLQCMDANGISIENIRLTTKNLPAYHFYNSKNVSIKELEITQKENPYITIEGSKTEKIKIEANQQINTNNIVIGKNVNSEAIEIISQ